MSALAASVAEDLRACASELDTYRVMVRLQRYAAPADLAAVAAATPDAPRAFRDWLRDFREKIRAADPAEGGHRQTEICRDVSLYRGAVRGDLLLVGFCGRAHMLFLPVAYLLPYFPSPRFDVLLLRDRSRGAFTAGVAGYAETFDRLVDRVRDDARAAGYQGLHVIGSSGGGAPALAAGRMLGAAVSVAACGHLPSESPVYGAAPGARRMEQALAEPPAAGERSWCLHGAACAPDAAAADRLARASHAVTRGVEGIDGHNVLLPLHLAGRLAPLFAELGVA